MQAELVVTYLPGKRQSGLKIARQMLYLVLCSGLAESILPTQFVRHVMAGVNTRDANAPPNTLFISSLLTLTSLGRSLILIRAMITSLTRQALGSRRSPPVTKGTFLHACSSLILINIDEKNLPVKQLFKSTR